MAPDQTFDPNYLQIEVFDTVIWTNADPLNQHDTDSLENYWGSPLLDPGATYSLTFPVTGVFPYQDSFYGDRGMTGTIVVLPDAPVLTNLTLVTDGSFQFDITNLVAGQTNIIQVSTNLAQWAGIFTNVASDTGYTFNDADAYGLNRRFYRVVVPP